jgi:hypothetical protein
MSAYTLERTLPTGEVKTQGPLVSKRRAASCALYVLTDNGVTTTKLAGHVAAELDRSPVGTRVAAYGYTFRILPASP